jgi:16S rRNA (guanine966-N2)-methyltransferase
VEGQLQVRQGDAMQFLAGPSGRFDLVFVDPPYQARLAGPVLRALAGHLNAGALIYVENDELLADDLLLHLGFSLVRQMQAGRVLAHLLETVPAARHGAAAGQGSHPTAGVEAAQRSEGG